MTPAVLVIRISQKLIIRVRHCFIDGITMFVIDPFNFCGLVGVIIYDPFRKPFPACFSKTPFRNKLDLRLSPVFAFEEYFVPFTIICGYSLTKRILVPDIVISH